ncbi:MAG: hypothetical protein PUE73_04300 [Eubacteriales bacterium]|nr:hypothetical protein [Eubacteriales bacterium]
MYTTAIWLKYILIFAVGIVLLLLGIILLRNGQSKKLEGVVALLISVSLLVYSGISCVRIEEPEYVTSRITYVSQVKNNKMFDKQYTFKDKYGKIYTLKMDPITHRKIFKNQQFCKNMRYFVTYDKHSKTIVKIK